MQHPLKILVLLAAMLTAVGCGWFNEAESEVSDVRCTNDVTLGDGPDFGITVSSTVKNVGGSGALNVTANLTTSDGEWSREQELQFEAGEQRVLSYFFAEPTIRAANIQCSIEVLP